MNVNVHLFGLFSMYQNVENVILHALILSQLLKSIVHKLHIVHVAFIIGIPAHENFTVAQLLIVKSVKLYSLAGNIASEVIVRLPSHPLPK